MVPTTVRRTRSPGRMPVTIVDALQAVDVDEADDEAPVVAPGSGDLVRYHEVAHGTPVRAGQVIEMRGRQGILETSPFLSLLSPFLGGASPVGGGLGTSCGTRPRRVPPSR
ncbi:hypothetical protein BH20CHL6_BH20CHL6_15480 [soil metagenome]